MAPKTIKKSIADALEDLSSDDLEKFRFHLLDRRDEPTVKRRKVEGKSFLVLADVLVRTFTEPKALEVTLETLRGIQCHEAACNLEEETSAQASKPDASEKEASAQASKPDASGKEASAQASEPDSSDKEHFVDKHQLQLIQRASISTLPSILDELLKKKVINKEAYEDIRSLRAPQKMMRELYSGPLQAGTACKDIFYNILVENEPYLMEDLKKTK